LCGDRIYCFGIKGDAVVFAAQPKFKILSHGKYDSGFMATPAVTGNAMILRTKTAVYRVEGK
jgi:hypothetical protein